MGELTKKHQRIINFALDRLFSPKSISGFTWKKEYSATDYFSRQLRLADNQTLMFTDAGLGHFLRIVTTIEEADVFDTLADYNDISAAFRHLIEDLLSKGMRPNNSLELLNLIKDRVCKDIDNYNFAVPLYGVKIEGTDTITIGSMKIITSLQSHLESTKIKYDKERPPKSSNNYLWLIGSEKGTPRVSQEKFIEQATLTIGMLAIHAGAIYDRGASSFRIGIVMSPEEGHEKAIWYSWKDMDDSEIGTHLQFKKSQPFVINETNAEDLSSNRIYDIAFRIFRSKDRSDLEDAIANAVYWYSDAHRDIRTTMKLVKFWSCIEAFFSIDKANITKSISVGLSSVLVYGGYSFVPEADYLKFKKRVAAVYDLRSHAVHTGSYKHISTRDIIELSQWASWLILNMLSFVDRGYSELKQIAAIADELDLQRSKPVVTL
jgi:hypothetical protein